MLILKYEYESEDDTVNNQVSCCLKKCKQYSVGRSNKNELRIKNDKSISRQHVLIKWDYNEDKQVVVWITNVGKLTAVGDKYFKVGETTSFKVSLGSDREITLSLGAKPIALHLIWKAIVWSVPSVDPSYLITLDNLGIVTDLRYVGYNSVTGILRSNAGYTTSDIVQLTYGVLRENCLLLDANILKSITELDGSGALEDDFDNKWGRLTQQRLFPDIQIDYGKFYDYFHDVVLYYICSECEMVLQWLEPVCKSTFKEFLVFKETTQFTSSILSGESRRVERCVIVSEEAISEYEIKVCTPAEFLDAIIRNNYRSLPFLLKTPIDMIQKGHTEDASDSTTQKRATPQESKEPILPKKRRLTRKKIQPLDSLHFFAGGGTPIQSPIFESPKKENVVGTNENLEQVKTPPSKELLSADKVTSNTPSVSATTPTFKAQSSDANEKDAPKAGIPLKDPFLSENIQANMGGLTEKSPMKPVDVSMLIEPVVESDVETGPRLQGTSPSKPDVKASEEQKREETKSLKPNKNIKRRLQLSSGNKISGKSTSNRLVEVIQSAKNKEVRRVQSTMVTISPEELTEEALNSFQGLNITPNDTLIRPNRNNRKSQGINDAWKGRKNFKTFVKIWPRSWDRNNSNGKNRADHDNNTSSIDFVKNSAFLITRDYVPLRRYDAHGISKDRRDHIGELINSRSFGGNNTRNTYSGFDNDETVLEQMAQMQQFSASTSNENQSQPRGKQLFVSVEKEDEDDFRGSSGDELLEGFTGPNVTVEIPSTYKRGSTSGRLVQLNAPTDNSRITNANKTFGEDLDSEDDSDDDDEPRFAFRSRK